MLVVFNTPAESRLLPSLMKIPSSLNNLPDLEIRHTSHVKKEEMKGFVIEKGKSLF